MPVALAYLFENWVIALSALSNCAACAAAAAAASSPAATSSPAARDAMTLVDIERELTTHEPPMPTDFKRCAPPDG